MNDKEQDVIWPYTRNRLLDMGVSEDRLNVFNDQDIYMVRDIPLLRCRSTIYSNDGFAGGVYSLRNLSMALNTIISFGADVGLPEYERSFRDTVKNHLMIMLTQNCVNRVTKSDRWDARTRTIAPAFIYHDDIVCYIYGSRV